jgi:hypothetical protein
MWLHAQQEARTDFYPYFAHAARHNKILTLGFHDYTCVEYDDHDLYNEFPYPVYVEFILYPLSDRLILTEWSSESRAFKNHQFNILDMAAVYDRVVAPRAHTRLMRFIMVDVDHDLKSRFGCN